MGVSIIGQGYHVQATVLTGDENMTINVSYFAAFVLQKLHVND
jgi:hypothetical protein